MSGIYQVAASAKAAVEAGAGRPVSAAFLISLATLNTVYQKVHGLWKIFRVGEDVKEAGQKLFGDGEITKTKILGVAAKGAVLIAIQEAGEKFGLKTLLRKLGRLALISHRASQCGAQTKEFFNSVSRLKEALLQGISHSSEKSLSKHKLTVLYSASSGEWTSSVLQNISDRIIDIAKCLFHVIANFFILSMRLGDLLDAKNCDENSLEVQLQLLTDGVGNSFENLENVFTYLQNLYRNYKTSVEIVQQTPELKVDIDLPELEEEEDEKESKAAAEQSSFEAIDTTLTVLIQGAKVGKIGARYVEGALNQSGKWVEDTSAYLNIFNSAPVRPPSNRFVNYTRALESASACV